MNRLLLLSLIFLTTRTVYSQAPSLTIREDMPASDVFVKQVTYGNGVFLAALLYPTRLYRSVDGVTWSKLAGPYLGVDTNLADYGQRPSLAYGMGRFVLVSDSGRIFSSSDLVSWTRSTTGTTRKLNAVKYLNNSFYAVGDTATFLSSPDAVNWTTQHIGIGDTTGSYKDVFYGNGHLVIAAYNHEFDLLSKQVLYLNTGGSWTGDSSRRYYGHGFAKDRFYEFSPDSTSISDDMQHWSAISYDVPAAGSPADVFDDSDRVYLLSNNYVTINGSPNERAFVSSSSDGVHFDSPYQTSVYGGGGAWFNHRYFIWGGISASPMAGSSDGLHYTIEGSDTTLLSTSGNGYVKLSMNPDGDHLFASPDFTHWTQTDTLSGLTGLSYDGARFWAMGPHTYTSVDGLTWTDNGIPPHAFTGMAYVAGRYIAWNKDVLYLGSDSLWVSTDATHWTQASTPISPDNGPKDPPHLIQYGSVTKVRFLNDTIFVVGSAGLILHSSDGLTYSLDYAGNTLGLNLRDVAYSADSGKYYFFGLGGDGYNNVTLTTTALANPFVSNPGLSVTIDTINGLPPGTQLAGLGTRQYTFLHSNGHFVSIVDDQQFPPYPKSHLIWSTDGVHWDSHALDRETQITDAVAKGDSFRIEGTHNYEIIASFGGGVVPLPVTLLDFNAKAQAGSTVLLSWKTSFEQNSRRFVVERSTGTTATQWDSIGYVPAAGNSSNTHDYNFTDLHPAPGFNSYRLHMTNMDNTFLTSAIRRVYVGSPASIVLYPNPARDQLTIRSTLPGDYSLTLYDARGCETLRQTFTGPALTLSLQNMAPGLYYLVLGSPDGVQYQYPIVHIR